MSAAARRRPVVLLAFPPDLADDRLLSARHRQRFRDILQQDLPVGVTLVADPALETADEIARDEAVAVHAHQTRAELDRKSVV